MSTSDVTIGGIFVGKLVAPKLYAEEVANRRWLIRQHVSPDFAKRVGEVMGGNGRFQAMLMKGDHVGIKTTLVDAAQLLVQT